MRRGRFVPALLCAHLVKPHAPGGPQSSDHTGSTLADLFLTPPRRKIKAILYHNVYRRSTEPQILTGGPDRKDSREIRETTVACRVYLSCLWCLFRVLVLVAHLLVFHRRYSFSHPTLPGHYGDGSREEERAEQGRSKEVPYEDIPRPGYTAHFWQALTRLTGNKMRQRIAELERQVRTQDRRSPGRQAQDKRALDRRTASPTTSPDQHESDLSSMSTTPSSVAPTAGGRDSDVPRALVEFMGEVSLHG